MYDTEILKYRNYVTFHFITYPRKTRLNLLLLSLFTSNHHVWHIHKFVGFRFLFVLSFCMSSAYLHSINTTHLKHFGFVFIKY